MAEPESTELAVSQAVLRRRAARRFDPDRPLPDDLLKRILSLATHAPSSYNLQPWRFVVVRTERNRKRLRACAFNQPNVSEAPVVVIVLGYLRAWETDLDAMLEQRVALGAATPESAAETRRRATDKLSRVADLGSWALRSAMIAVGMMLLAAESLGVASAPMEGFDPSRIKDVFGVPDDHVVCALVALGYALETDPFPGRFGLEHVCYEEHFGGPWHLGEPDRTEAGGACGS